MNDLNLIFIGGFFPKQFSEAILEKSKLQIQNAANTFQWAFIKGLEQNLNKNIRLVTAPYIGWYPKYYNDICLRTHEFVNGDDSVRSIMVGFINLPLVKNYHKYLNLTYHINKLVAESGKTVLLVYSLDTAYLKAAIKAKAINPDLRVCVIIPDLHEFPGDASFLYKCYLKYYEKPTFYELLSKIDGFVVLTDKMVEYLNIGHKPWIRIEGLYDVQSSDPLQGTITKNDFKTILYTGTLEYKYGIKELLNAFALIKSDEYQLWICGGGVGADLVKERALSDNRIKYFGIVTKQRVTELQKEATILINPRNPVGEYNKYSFPSKTMEYFASGTPTLMYKIDGVPEEYFQYCYTIEGSTIEDISAAMYSTCELDKSILQDKGKSARAFILNNKSSEMQCKKVLDMLRYMFNE